MFDVSQLSTNKLNKYITRLLRHVFEYIKNKPQKEGKNELQYFCIWINFTDSRALNPAGIIIDCAFIEFLYISIIYIVHLCYN
jgi:hypothetical protein